jgi:hypothetical protein
MAVREFVPMELRSPPDDMDPLRRTTHTPQLREREGLRDAG